MDKKKKSPRKSNAPKIKDLDIQQRKLAIIKQKRCDSIALNIVSKLIDCRVQEDVFLRSLKYLNQCHYQDIVEERAISKLCGYPICGNEIKDMPAKKYHISTKSNKVYDITERKNYCSNFCYKAGVHIKEQMLTSPLWFRDKEEIPDFNLLPRTVTGVPGEEIDQGIIKLDVEEDTNFTSISQFTQDVINDIPDKIYNKINIEENLQQSQKNDLKIEESIKEKNENVEINSYISSIYGPSLADILKENAEYFEKQNGNQEKNNLNKKTIKEEEKSESIIQKITENVAKLELSPNSIESNELKNKIDSSEASTSSYKVKFDRTVINTNTTKGILKKSKKNSGKKRVSFSAENSVKEIEGIPDAKKVATIQQFKKPEQIKATEKKYKNMNLIGVVQERCTVYKRKTEKQDLEIKDNKEVGENEKQKDDYSDKVMEDLIQFNNKLLQGKCNESRISQDSKILNTESKIPLESNIGSKIPVDLNTELKVPVDSNISKTKSSIPLDSNTGTKIPEDSKTGCKIPLDSNISNTESKIPLDSKTESNTRLGIPNGEFKNPESSNILNADSNKQLRSSRLKNSSTYKKSVLNNPKSQVPLKPQSTEIDLQTRLNNCVSEWFTFETALFLYGEEYVKKNLCKDENFVEKYLSKKKSLELDEKKQKQYEEICKTLNLMELADQNFDEKVTGKKRRPLPRYETLRDQAEHMDLRVQAFYAGCYEMYEEDVTDTDTDVEADDEEKPYVVQGPPAVLPLVENKDVMAMRRKIFQTSVSRTISTICEVLQESPNRLLAEIKHLINTFEFTATNIVFKTNEWPFITLFLIQMLSMKDKELQTALASKEATVYLSSLIQELNISNKYVEENLLKKAQLRNLLDDCMRKENIHAF